MANGNSKSIEEAVDDLVVTAQINNQFYDVIYRSDAIKLIEQFQAQGQKPVAGLRWISVVDKPLITYDENGNWTCTEEGDKPFIAAVAYEDKRQPNKILWWIRQCIIEDAIGLCVMCDDDNEPCGWEISSITHYIPLPLSPTEQPQQPDEHIAALLDTLYEKEESLLDKTNSYSVEMDIKQRMSALKTATTIIREYFKSALGK